MTMAVPKRLLHVLYFDSFDYCDFPLLLKQKQRLNHTVNNILGECGLTLQGEKTDVKFI